MAAPGLLLIAVRLALAVVFAAAGLGKLADPAGSRQAVASFGAPASAVDPLAAALPWVELALAAALLTAATSWFAALAALALLAIFLAAMIFNLARGRAPDCHCFGQFHSSPVGPRTIGVNLAMCAGAGVLIASGRANPGPELLGWLGSLSLGERVAVALGAATLAAVAAIGFLMWQMLLQQGRLLLRLDVLEARLGGGAAAPEPEFVYQPEVGAGLLIGTLAPEFALPDATGETIGLATMLAAGRPLVLIFTSPTCGPCEALTPTVAGWRAPSAPVRIVMIAEGDPAHYSAALGPCPDHPILGEEGRRTAEAYQVWGTPSAVLVEADGRIGSRAAGGADAIAGLMNWVADRSGAPAPLAIARRHRQPAPPDEPIGLALGAPAPGLQLADARGQAVDLGAARERDALLLFWNPGCGFCQQMLGDLQRWDADPPAGGPDLIVISSGSADSALAMGLRSPVLLDPDLKAGAAFGAHGTPMAVLLDRQARVASPVAAGAAAVLGLARSN